MTSAVGTNAQTLCINTAITNITYSTTGATGATFIGLPAGVTGNWASNVVTLSGTPTTSGTFNYTATTTGGCGGTTATGIITVTPNNTIILTSAVGTNAQTHCLNTAITNITYSTTGATGATFSGLPAGVTGNWVGNVVTISGTPSASGTFNYTVTTTGGCGGTTVIGTITVNPLPNVTVPTNIIVCPGATIASTSFTSSIGGSTFTWTNSNTAIGLAASGSGNVPSFTSTNATAAAIVATITVTPTSPGPALCAGPSSNYTITVNPNPAITSVPFTNETSCGAADGTITINATGVGLTFSINGGSTFSASNTFTGLGGGSYSVIVKNSSGCTVSGGTISISSASAPAAPTALASPNPLCAGSTLTLSVTVPVGGQTYNWSGPGGYTATGTSATINNVTTAMSGVYGVTATTGICVSPAGTVTVTVNPLPTVTVPANITLCANATVAATTFTSSPAGATYTWINSNTAIGLAASGSGNIGSFTATNATLLPITATITVTPTSAAPASCTGPSSTYTITVNPLPTASVPANITLCANGTVAATNFSSIPAGATFTWTNSNTAIGLAASGSGDIGSFTASNVTSSPITATITVTPTSAAPASCPGPDSTYTITVNPLPTVTVPSNITLCVNGTVAATNFSSTPAGATYTWTNSNTAIGLAASGSGDIGSFTATNSTSSPITATITVTPTSAAPALCSGVSSLYTITVNPMDDASFSYSGGTTYCQSGTDPIATPTIPGGTFSSTPGLVFLSTTTGLIDLSASTLGTYVVTYTTSGVCPNTSTVSITISLAPSSTYNYAGNATSFCQMGVNPTPIGNIGTFTSSPVGLNFVNVNTGEINLATSTPGTYSVVNTISGGGCATSKDSLSITINPSPTMTNASTAAICSGIALNIPLTSNVPSTYTWVATDNLNTAGESITNQTTGTVNDVITNNTSSSQTVVYNVTLVSTTGSCSNATPQTITVIVDPAPTMTNANTATVCSGTALNNPLTGSINSTYTWVATDNVNTSGESITNQTTGTVNDVITNNTSSSQTVVYDITLVSTSGNCSNTTPQTLTVTVDPAPTMTNANTATLCSGTALNIPLTGSINSTYIWVAADNVNTIGESISNQTTGIVNDVITNNTSSSQTLVYDVTLLSILGNCSNTTPQTLSVTVNPLPVADSSSLVIAAASCGSSTGSISGLTVISGQSPFTYLWQNASGDTVGTNLNLTNVGPGNYILTITDANTCTSPFGAGSGLNIASTSGVVAAFTASPTTGETPLIVNFTNSSTGATSYLWQFGTGAEDVSTNPTYIYTSFGSFTACLIASNIGGCSDTACSVIDVYINSVFVIPNVFTPNDDGVNDVFGVIGKGLKTLDAEIYNRWGEKLFEWHTPNGGWDGRTASGELSPVGTYYFIVNATGDDGKHYSEKGAFTLIR